jgi:hypothetical protein
MAKTTNKTLFDEAIADAKQIKEVALKNAKIAIADAFNPKLQAMFSEKIKQEVEGGEDDENIEVEDEPVATNEEGMEDDGEDEVKSTADDDQTVKEEDGEKIDTEEPVVSEEDDKDIDIEDDEPKTEDEPVQEEDEKSEDEKELEEILKELEGDENPATEDDEIKMENEDNDEDDIPVDTDPVEDEPKETTTEEEEIPAEEPKTDDDDEDINIDELVADMKEEDEPNDEYNNYELEEQKKKTARAEKNLSEAIKVIKSLKTTMNEVNLLNSKLLYANKLFRQYEKLSESQKLKIIDNMDKANSLREVKLVYVTLVESLKSTSVKKEVNGTTKRLTESIASGIVGNTQVNKKKVILESNEIRDRFQKLANISNDNKQTNNKK